MHETFLLPEIPLKTPISLKNYLLNNIDTPRGERSVKVNLTLQFPLEIFGLKIVQYGLPPLFF